VSADFPGHGPDDLPGAIPGDLLGDITASEPGLDALLGRLTADPTPDELTGETTALAMFRANRQPVTPATGTREFEPFALEPFGPRPSSRRGRRAGLMAAAVTLAAAAGLVVAAYTAALPAPLQQAAYHALGFAGVPAAGHSAPSAATSPPPGSGRGHGSSHQAGHSPQTGAPASPKPGGSGPAPASGQAGLSITAASGRIVAGGNDTFTGQLTGPSGAVAGASLSLLERAAGQRAWSLAGTATTSSSGSAVVNVSGLTTNAVFRLKGPDGALSQPVLVIVQPTVSAQVGNSNAHGVTVTADSPLAVPGDTVVLQIQFGAHWLSVQKGRLNRAGQAGFPVRPKSRKSVYRVVLLPTAAHGTSVSNAVTVSPR
jgi:hypothetical protein